MNDNTSPAVLEVKTLSWEVKALGDDGSFTLYAACFNNIDRQGEIIAPGAFRNIDEFVKDGWGALNHDNMALPVAWIDTAQQDGTGLLVTGRFHSTDDAQDCRTVVRERMGAGKSVKCSIGFMVLDSSTETRNGDQVRVLNAIDVWEFSFVNLPANPLAAVTDVKSLELKAVSLNSAGLAFGKSCIKAGNVSDGAWSFTGADGDALLGQSGDDWTTFGKCFLAKEGDATDQTKGAWKYPFAKKVGGTIKLFVAALRAIRSRAAQQNATGVYDAAGTLLDLAQPDDEDDGDKAAGDGAGDNSKDDSGDGDEKTMFTLEAVQSLISGIKTGKVLGSAIHGQLKDIAEEMHGQGKAMCKSAQAFKAVLAQHAPTKPPADDDGDEDDKDDDGDGDGGETGMDVAATKHRLRTILRTARCP